MENTDNIKSKKSYGVPNIEYNTFYRKGFEKIDEKSLVFTLYSDNLKDVVNFRLKIPLNHLKIEDNRFISELDTNDDANRYLVYLLDSIYGYNGANLDDEISEDGIMYNLDIEDLCSYINAMSRVEIALCILEDELVYFDIYEIKFPDNSEYKYKNFKDYTYELHFSIGTNLSRIYSQSRNYNE